MVCGPYLRHYQIDRATTTRKISNLCPTDAYVSMLTRTHAHNMGTHHIVYACAHTDISAHEAYPT